MVRAFFITPICLFYNELPLTFEGKVVTIILQIIGNVTGNITGKITVIHIAIGTDKAMTIKDIARLSGVSVSTVSRVLNNRPDVSEESRRRVRSVIENASYIPNNTARDLVKTKSDAIGLVVRGISNPFYTDVITAIEKKIENAGYTMVMRQIASDTDEIQCGAEMEREKRLLGIIFLGGCQDYTPERLKVLNVPFVCCTYTNKYGTIDSEQYSSVSIEDQDEAYRAVDILIKNGHRCIAALVSATDDGSISQLRYQGYLKALKDNGIEYDPGLVIEAGGFSIADAYRAVAGKLNENNADFTALFTIADVMAMGAMRALRERGKRVPEDCSVIAIDGIAVSEYIHPMLSTLCQPVEEMGQKSVDILLDIIEGRCGNRHVVLPTCFREGASICKLN